MPRAAQALDRGGAVSIVKYENRRMYDRGLAEYIKHDDVLAYVKRGYKVQITYRVTGQDVTSAVLLRCLAMAQEKEALVSDDEAHKIVRKILNRRDRKDG